MNRTLLQIPTVLLAAALVTACTSSGPAAAPAAPDTPVETATMTATDAATPDASAVSAALAAAADGAPYHLIVHCADEAGIRAFELFPDGVAIWRSASQIQVPETVQRSLIHLLQSGDFANFRANYGGKQDSGKAEPAPAKAGKAPLTIRCRITFDGQGLTKTSIQDLYGHQFAGILELSDSLLDQVEPLAADAISARDLDDGLAKLAAGELSPQVFALRLVALPGAGSDEAGFILRVENGNLSRRPYAPGRQLGDAGSEPVTRADLERMIAAVQEADFTSLPTNVYADDQLEVEVRVLDHHKAVLARPFTSLQGKDGGDAGERLAALVELLSSIDAG